MKVASSSYLVLLSSFATAQDIAPTLAQSVESIPSCSYKPLADAMNASECFTDKITALTFQCICADHYTPIVTAVYEKIDPIQCAAFDNFAIMCGIYESGSASIAQINEAEVALAKIVGGKSSGGSSTSSTTSGSPGVASSSTTAGATSSRTTSAVSSTTKATSSISSASSIAAVATTTSGNAVMATEVKFANVLGPAIAIAALLV